MKTCNNRNLKWVSMAPLIFWANQVTICWSISYSPFFMAHGIEAVLLLDIAGATYLLPPLNAPVSTKDLIAYCAQQLQKHLEDLLEMSVRVLKARKQSTAEFVKNCSSTIQDYDFQVVSLVLFTTLILKRNLTTKQSLGSLGP